jgi:hypothetical protein
MVSQPHDGNPTIPEAWGTFPSGPEHHITDDRGIITPTVGQVSTIRELAHSIPHPRMSRHRLHPATRAMYAEQTASSALAPLATATRSRVEGEPGWAVIRGLGTDLDVSQALALSHTCL